VSISEVFTVVIYDLTTLFGEGIEFGASIPVSSVFQVFRNFVVGCYLIPEVFGAVFVIGYAIVKYFPHRERLIAVVFKVLGQHFVIPHDGIKRAAHG
jgi:hypothetical protein